MGYREESERGRDPGGPTSILGDINVTTRTNVCRLPCAPIEHLWGSRLLSPSNSQAFPELPAGAPGQWRKETPLLHCPEKHLSPPTGRPERSIGSHGHCQWSQVGRLGELGGRERD